MNLVASVLIPVRDEAAAIEECLAAVAAQTVGAGALEIVVADDSSTDDTVRRVHAAGACLGFGRTVVVTNERGGIGAGCNAALAAATCDVVVRVDARSRISPTHVEVAVATLADRSDVAIAGGGQVARPGGAGLEARAVARALRNRWFTGLAAYRRSSVAGSTDTVWMGAFRTAQLRSVGGWDESLAVNEDYELAERMRATGAAVWFDPRLTAAYVARPTIASLGAQYDRYGRVKGARWRGGARIAPRQVVLLAAPPLGLVVAAMIGRRLGLVRTAFLAMASAVLVDRSGVEPAGDGVHADSMSDAAVGGPSVAERVLSLVAGGVLAAAWWRGVVVGFSAPAAAPGDPRSGRAASGTPADTGCGGPSGPPS